MAALKRNRAVTRWVYGAIAVVLAFLISTGIENGLREVWLFGVVLCLCILQAWRPTFVVWSVLLVAFGLYTAAIAVGMPKDPIGEYLVFLALAAIPTALLVWCGPRTTSKDS